MNRYTITITLEVESARYVYAEHVLDRVLDEGILQNAINGHEYDAGRVQVRSALVGSISRAEVETLRAELAALRAELAWCLAVIEHEVKPPESCGACGTPNAQCGGECADAAYHAEHMRAIRALMQNSGNP